MKRYISLLLIFATFNSGIAQQSNFSKQDTLRGSITPERVWWDLLHYNLDFKVSPSSKNIKGSNLIRYEVLSQNQLMQIDLQPPMEITSVLENKKELNYNREGNVYYIQLKKNQQIGAINEIIIHFKGAPKISNNPPWDDGFTWGKDNNGTDFIATSCQGGGSSIWWPSKDHMYDEPDQGIELSITAPKHLISVSNGRHIQTKENSNKTNTSTWKVVNPINNYGVNINIGDYVHFTEEYKGKKGVLDCDYYVVSYNLEKAKKQFKEVSRTLEAFEHWFGPYPFYEDSYKLVEVPYLGMEHQSSVTYGNGFKNGYKGIDLSGTGWGLKFDFIIVHESGHEWFANNITNIDIADMWIHESFTAYSENLFLDYHFGTEASNAYVTGTRKNIQNDKPIIGNYNVNNSGSSDMYYKGANMLHTLRQIIDNDKKWRSILVGLNKDFYHQTVTTLQIENYIDKYFEIDLKPFFNQYLRTIKIPTLDYKLENNNLLYKWSNVVDGFSIPIKVFINSTSQWIRPTSQWKKLLSDKNIYSFSVDNNFYIETENKSD
ncbi:M1 family metallopeptidase [Flavobacteriaceae bacterium]|nr:M1 family metallopeptidase [Flavobacteriaceae bacterium]MDB2427382.1 M1 family metallopeptidase [Flavobacteriaceae bacterium]MDC0331962.1 M1 family metallopeptidase [Flavobacteriaceae bacterium]